MTCVCVCIHTNTHLPSDLLAYIQNKEYMFYLDNYSNESNMVGKLLQLISFYPERKAALTFETTAVRGKEIIYNMHISVQSLWEMKSFNQISEFKDNTRQNCH